MRPYLFNETQILYPLTWDETRNVVETVSTSEAGTDIIQIVRKGKLNISASFKVTKEWLKTFQEFSELDTFTLSRYDASLGNYTTHTVRMRSFKAKLIKNSWKLADQEGLWEISFNLLEV